MTADEPLICTGTLSQSPGQFEALWAMRERLTECIQKEGKPYKYDVSVPLARFQSVVDAVRERMIAKDLYGDHAVSKVMGYGHVGDGAFFRSGCFNLGPQRVHRKSAFERHC